MAGDRVEVDVRLWLDDWRPAPVGWTLARSVAEAQAVTLRYRVVAMSLDHDLGACRDCIATIPEAAATLHCAHVPDGRAFLRWAIEGGHLPRDVALHTRSQRYRPEMQRMLDEHRARATTERP